MTITAYPRSPQADGTCLLVFTGPPNVAVAWSIAGPGTLMPQGAHTDDRGAAGCIFTPVSAGDAVTITVTHGT